MPSFSPLRWGILGTGAIAKQFATGLQSLPDAQLIAVGSRTAESAEHFAGRFNIPHKHASYAALAADPEVDAIYVATPHSLHRDMTELCLRHDKPVLCEKPFAINAHEAESMIRLARERGLFLMEAMWTRFLPLMVQLREILAAGVIGELRMLTSDFGFRTNVNPRSRLFDLALGGGALLDVGVYPISLASMLFGVPERIVSMADLGETGVDEQAGIVLGYTGAKMALLATAIRTQTPMETLIMGSAGSIRIHSPSWCPTKMTITSADDEAQLIEIPYSGNGYNYEAAEVASCLRSGLSESPIMPLDETREIMRTLDAVRAQWNLRYPME